MKAVSWGFERASGAGERVRAEEEQEGRAKRPSCLPQTLSARGAEREHGGRGDADADERKCEQEPHFTKRLHGIKPHSIGRWTHFPRLGDPGIGDIAENPSDPSDWRIHQMKLRILVLALVTGLIGASVALAKESPGPGRPEAKPKPGKSTTGPNCRPRVKVVLRGTLANDPATGDTAFQLNATRANRHGRAYLSASQPLTIGVEAATKFRRKGPGAAPTKTLDSLALGDLVKVRAKACKAELRNGGTPDLTARHVKARPAPASTS
jgi:hypothetical protein